MDGTSSRVPRSRRSVRRRRCAPSARRRAGAAWRAPRQRRRSARCSRRRRCLVGWISRRPTALEGDARHRDAPAGPRLPAATSPADRRRLDRVRSLSAGATRGTSSTSTCSAPIVLTNALLPALRDAPGATWSSPTPPRALHAKPGWAAYSSSKFGLRGFADSLWAEEKGSGTPGDLASCLGRTGHAHAAARCSAQEGREYDPSALDAAGDGGQRRVLRPRTMPPVTPTCRRCGYGPRPRSRRPV